MVIKTALSWSSGKDSAWTLHVLRAHGIEVSALLTTVNETFGRVAMHAVRRELLEAQAEAVGIVAVLARGDVVIIPAVDRLSRDTTDLLDEQEDDFINELIR